MKRLLASLAAAAVVSGLVGGCSTARSPAAADYRLAVPQSQAGRAYLGLPAAASSFRLEDVRCDILVIDCFDMYCHLCQVGAKHVNELYQFAQERRLGDRVKFVGLGAGDTPLEVATYKEKLKIPFPVFPDRRAVIAKQFGELRLPNLIVLRNQHGHLEVIHRSPGPLRDPAELLSHIQAGLTQVTPDHWTDTLQAAQPTCEASSPACRNPGVLQGQKATSAPKPR